MNLNSKDLNASRRKVSEGFHDLLEGVEEMLRASGRHVKEEADASSGRVSRSVDHVREWADDVGSKARRGYHDVAESAHDYASTAQTYVKSHPGQVAGIAAAVAGVIIACLLTQRR